MNISLKYELMNQTVTLNDLIRFAYNETEILQTVLVLDALEYDEEAIDCYIGILACKEMFENILTDPSSKVIASILNYAAGKSVIYAPKRTVQQVN